MNTMIPNKTYSLLSQINKFASDLKKSKQDPQQLLNDLISSGKVTKEQVDKATMLAKLFSKQNKL